MKKSCLWLFIVVIQSLAAVRAQAPRRETWVQKKFQALCIYFVGGYKALHLAPMKLSYVSTLKDIKPADSIQMQLVFFKTIQSRLAAFNKNELSPSQKTDYVLMGYQTDLALQRIALERRWLAGRPDTISAAGIYKIPGGKSWYAYLLKLWVGDQVSPGQIFQFGLKEVKRVQRHLQALGRQTGLSEDDFYHHLNDSSFFTNDSSSVQRGFEHTREVVYRHLPELFHVREFPVLKIKRGTQKVLAQTPGYYDDNTFYYNLFDKPYNKRDFGWLFIHESVPGHHYQQSIIAKTKVSVLQQLFFYPGFAEGWAAYTEELGKKLGAYPTPYDELGKWQWDIVRSVRVPLDVGLNYYGWTDQKALEFWKKNIRGQDDIAMREINRMRRWPAQVVTYKYGALQILHWKEALAKSQGKNFDIRNFHDRILNYGSLPLFMVKQNVFSGEQ